MDIEATPFNICFDSVSLPHTRSAFTCLEKCLQCRKCSQLSKDLFTLGQCEHRFCWSCVQDRQGTTCPVCNMPAHATQAHVDKQLSNIASLCLHMSDLLNGKHLTSADERIKDDLDTVNVVDPKRNRRSKSEVTKPQVQRYNVNSTRRNSMKNLTVPKIGNYGDGNTNSNYLSDRKRHSGKGENSNSENAIASNIGSVSKVKEKGLVSSNSQNIDSLKSKTVSCSKREQKMGVQQNLLAKESLTENNQERLLTRDSCNIKKESTGKKIQRSTTKERKNNKTYLTKRNAKGETPLQVVTIKADVEKVRHLLEEGANPNVRDNAGWTPLHEAVNLGCHMIAELLINYGASVNAPGLDNDTPLHDAVVNYRLECVKLLVSRGANSMARNINGHTPLDQARTDEMREILLTSSSTSQQASDMNTSMIKELDSNQPLCLLGTVLSKDEQATLLRCAQLLKAKVVDDFSSEVTHLITGVNAEGMCPRTIKYLNVVLAGKWVVSTVWLNSCVRCGSRVPEEDFEIAGCTNNPSTMAPMKARQNALSQLPGLFDGCQFYFHGKFNYPTPSREELASLVKLGGGVILTREPRLYNLDDYPYTVPYHALPSSDLVDCSIFVIYDETCLNPPYVEAQRMTCLPASWIMDSIATFSLLNKAVYLTN